ncbi:MAG: hypothetical protein ACLU38_03050 [Dysosmobacter sp.]
MKTAIQTISERSNLLIFPEGTTVRNGDRQGGSACRPTPTAARGGDRCPYRRRLWCRCSWMEKSGPSTGHASSSASPYCRYATAAGGLLRKSQKIADDLLREIYALGGQQVGGAPLCK